MTGVFFLEGRILEDRTKAAPPQMKLAQPSQYGGNRFMKARRTHSKGTVKGNPAKGPVNLSPRRSPAFDRTSESGQGCGQCGSRAWECHMGVPTPPTPRTRTSQTSGAAEGRDTSASPSTTRQTDGRTMGSNFTSSGVPSPGSPGPENPAGRAAVGAPVGVPAAQGNHTGPAPGLAHADSPARPHLPARSGGAGARRARPGTSFPACSASRGPRGWEAARGRRLGWRPAEEAAAVAAVAAAACTHRHHLGAGPRRPPPPDRTLGAAPAAPASLTGRAPPPRSRALGREAAAAAGCGAWPALSRPPARCVAVPGPAATASARPPRAARLRALPSAPACPAPSASPRKGPSPPPIGLEGPWAGKGAGLPCLTSHSAATRCERVLARPRSRGWGRGGRAADAWPLPVPECQPVGARTRRNESTDFRRPRTRKNGGPEREGPGLGPSANHTRARTRTFGSGGQPGEGRCRGDCARPRLPAA